MMFSSIESRVGTDFQPSVLSYAKLLHITQLKMCDRNSKKILYPRSQFSWQILKKNTHLKLYLPDL